MNNYDPFEEERLYWKKLLDNGEIDYQTYIKNIDVINMRNNFHTHEEEKYGIYASVKNNRNPNTIITKFIFLLVIILCCYFVFRSKYVKKNYVSVNDLGELSSPYQQSATGQVYRIIDGTEVDIKFVAEYILNGRVVKTYSYPQFSIENKLAPKDIGVSWGKIAKDENHNKIQYSNSGNRFLKWVIYDTEWYNSIGSRYFEEHVSNNHVIPSDDEIMKKINAIKEDDFITLKGFLVNVTYITSNGSRYTWNSSTSRSDTGNGACEVFYVTSVDWLEEVGR